MFGKLGSGKRTLAAQVAIRIAKKNPALKLKIVTEGDTITEDLESRHSTILVIHDPVKSWYTDRYTEEIISILLKICTSAKNKDNNFYIIVVFHCNCDWNSLQFGNKKNTMETMFPKREPIYGKKLSVKLSEMVKDNHEDISNVPFQKGKKSTKETFELTLFIKNPAFQHYVLDNPVMSIIEALRSLERSNQNYEQLAFKIILIVMLRGGKIAKSELLGDDILHHELFVDLIGKMNVKESIIGCTEQLLKIFVEETGERSFRILHDVITRCTFLVAFKNHRTLLFKECDSILIFECLRLKLFSERLLRLREVVYDYNNLQIRISEEIFEDIARLFFQRTGMRSILQKSRLYENEKFKDEWNKTEQHFSNEIHVTNETDN